ncbi:ExeM/NucH family extracellular endonuclease [Fibrivirga algicola]|uniref:ExeM/NucH family extracellular endonuclease n=1 Tax=Fibrivirga algicola TaxID=2950420 RepID=UPI001AAFF3E6|nr:ExeM/NucH family extracellular endonuclease [Fibrivirga algicola]
MNKPLQQSYRTWLWLMALLWVQSTAWAQTPLLTDDFNTTSLPYSLTSQGWGITGTAAPNSISALAPGLTYSGLTTAGGSASLTTSGEDVNRTFASQTSGSVYASFLVQVTTAQSGGDYFLNLGPSPIGTAYFGRVHVKSVSGGIQFGLIKAATETVTYNPTTYSLGTTYLLVLKYTFVSGTTNDQVSLFIEPALGQPEPTPAISLTPTTGDATQIGAVALRQGGSGTAAGLRVDYIRVGTSWGDVTSSNGTSTVATLSATPTALNGFLATSGTASDVKQYTLSGANLATQNAVVISATNGIELSTDGNTFTTEPLSFSPASESISRVIYARIANTAAIGQFTGTITNTYNGTLTASVTVAGTVNSPQVTYKLISVIQGSGATSPLVGNTVTIEGIVTRTFAGATKLNGFYVQEEDSDADGNPATSEGIFVYDPTGLFIGNTGDKVRVSGTVAEFTSGTNSSLTQLTTLTSVVNLNASTLPAATSVTLPVASISDLERYEGMLVTMSAATGNLAVTEYFQLGRYGQVTLSATGSTDVAGTDSRLDQYTQFYAPSVSGYATYLDETAKRKIILDDGSGVQNTDPILFGRGGQPLSAANPLRGGDEVASVTAILDHRLEGYRLQTTTGVDFQPTNVRPATPPAVGGTLRVSGFNLLNYFNGDGQGGGFPTSRGADNINEFNRQRAKTIKAVVDSGVDIFAFNELENDGYGANSAIQDIINGVNAATAPGTFTFINAGNISTDEITVAMIYKPGKVTPVGASAAIPSGFGNGAFDVVGRKPLAQTFRENATNAVFTVVTNHWKSKGSSSGGAGDTDAGDGQGQSNGTRTRQAQDLVNWLATKPTGTTDPDYLILGDLNSYAKEDPLTTLHNNGYQNLIPNTTYSYVFDGFVGALDHALGNSTLAAQVASATKWHINADEPAILDYNTEFKSTNQISSYYSVDPFRTSDHDPVVVGLSLTPPPATALSLTVTASPTTLLANGTTTISAAVSGGTPTYTYSFDGPGTISASANTATVSGLTAGVQTFTVVVTDATLPTSQTVTETVSVTVNEVPTVSLAANVVGLSGFTATQGTPSASQLYTLSASNLTADITVTAPAGVEVSSNNSTFSSSLVLPQATTSATIYARLTGASVGAVNGTITNVSGSLTATVQVGGTVSAVVSQTGAAVVISQVYGGGGNSGATYRNDFIELYNRSSSPVSLAGWSVQYASATGSSWQVTNLNGTIQPGGYYLIQEAGSTSTTFTSLPTPDATGNIPMSGTAGKVALVNVTTALSGTCPMGASIIDFVGFGTTANCFEGTGPTAAPSNTLAVLRKLGGQTDTDNNAQDFATGAPTPRNSGPVVVVASLVATPSSLTGASGLSYLEGSGPASGNISVSGSNLNTASGNITISSSTTALTVSPATLPFSNSTLSATSFSVQLIAGLSAGNYSGTITLSGGGATLTVPVTAIVNPTQVTATLISAIQGSGAISPLVGNTVTIEGIVTRTFAGATKQNGFYVQEEDSDADGNPATSEGIFVYDPAGLFAGVAGQKVQVTGTVAEFATTSGGVSHSLTQLATLVSVVSVGTPGALPTAANVTLPVANISDLERYEGMLVTMSAATGNLAVTEYFELGRYGQIVLSATGSTDVAGTDPRLDQYTQFYAPSVSGYATYLAETAKRTIILDDGSSVSNPDPILFGRGGQPLSAANPLRGGDEVASVTAVLDERFEGYRLQTTTGVDFQPTNVRPATPPAVGGTLRVSGFNLLNYFNGDGQGGGFPTSRGANTLVEFNRQRAKTIKAVVDSGVDIFAFNELENDGYGANSAIQDIINGVNATTAPGTFTFINAGNISTDQITVAMIYKPGKVTPVGASAAIPSGFGNGAFDVVGRKPLAQTFRENATSEVFTVVTNHWKSKGSSSGGAGDADSGDGQGFSNGTRTRQALDLVNWLATKPTGTTDPDYLILGDLNSYAKEDPLTTLHNNGYQNLIPNTTYSYVFDGFVGALDHALGNSTLAAQMASATKWHINADEPTVLDYNTENKTSGQISSYYNADPFRTSDHDPVVVGLSLNTPVAALSVTLTADPTQLLTSSSTSLSATVSGGKAPFSYSFSGPGTLTPSGNTATVSGLSAGEQIFTVVVTDATTPANQTVTQTVSVTVNQANRAPVATTIANQATLAGQAYSFDVASVFSDPDNQALTYSASGLPTGLTLNGSTISGTPTVLGTSTITITATDPGSLAASTSFDLTVNAVALNAVTATATPATVCPSGTATVFATITGGTAPFTYVWTGPATITNALTATATVSNLTTSGVYTYTVLVTDTYNQTATAETTVTVSQSPVASITPSTTSVCAGGTATLTASAGSSYLWNTGATTQAIDVTSTGTYSVTVTSAGGCQAVASASVTVNQPVTAPALSSVTAVQGSANVVLTAANCTGTLVWTGAASGSGSSITVSTATLGSFVYNVQCQVGECTSPATSVTVTIVPTPNTAPTVANSIPNQTATRGLPFSYSIPTNTFADDAGVGGLTVTVTGLPAGLSFVNGTITGTPTTIGMSTVTVKATDAGNLSVSTTFVLTVNAPPNAAPTVANLIPNQTATKGLPFSYSIPTNTFADDAGAANLVVTVTGLPAGLSFVNGTITGTPTTTGTSTVTVKATDSGNLSVSTTFVLTVNAPTPVNTAPVAASVANQTTIVNVAFNLQLPSFSDAETPNQLNYSVSGLPKGLRFSEKDLTIVGTPSVVGTSTITLTATDPGNLSASTSFVLTVNPTPVNTAPTVVSPVANKTVTVGQMYSLNVVPLFTDLETPTQLEYSVSGLQKGVNFDKKTNLISGTPNNAGVLTVTITATDPGKLSASITYTLTFKAANGRIGAEEPGTPLSLQVDTYPNPVVGEAVSVQIRNVAQQSVQLRLIDLRGNVIQDRQVTVLTDQHTERVELSSVPAGMYLIQVSAGNQTKAKAIIK